MTTRVENAIRLDKYVFVQQPDMTVAVTEPGNPPPRKWTRHQTNKHITKDSLQHERLTVVSLALSYQIISHNCTITGHCKHRDCQRCKHGCGSSRARTFLADLKASQHRTIPRTTHVHVLLSFHEETRRDLPAKFLQHRRCTWRRQRSCLGRRERRRRRRTRGRAPARWGSTSRRPARRRSSRSQTSRSPSSSSAEENDDGQHEELHNFTAFCFGRSFLDVVLTWRLRQGWDGEANMTVLKTATANRCDKGQCVSLRISQNYIHLPSTGEQQTHMSIIVKSNVRSAVCVGTFPAPSQPGSSRGKTSMSGRMWMQ